MNEVKEYKELLIKGIAADVRKLHDIVRFLQAQPVPDKSLNAELFFFREKFIRAVDTHLAVHGKETLSEDDSLIERLLNLSREDLEKWLDSMD